MRQTQTCEWASLGEAVLVATAGRAWLTAAPQFAAPMTGPGTPATTRKLLDGAIGAAWSRAPRSPTPPAMTPARWLWRLAGYYHLTHATPRLMAIAARRFAEAGRDTLAAWASDKAREEQGHDRLALRDIAAMGWPAERLVAAVIPASAADLVAHFTASVVAEDPIACVGYAYTLERLALTVGAADIAAVQGLLPPGVDATRCMRVHSAIGSDADHVDDDIAVIAGLSAPERAAVVTAVFTTASLCARPPLAGHLGEPELTEIFSKLKH